MKRKNKNWHKPQPNITCERCGYKWHTTSKAKRVKCPFCTYSTL